MRIEHICADRLARGEKILAGSLAGERFFAECLDQRIFAGKGEIVIIDFKSIEVVTASFLREGIVSLRDYGLRYKDSYIVIANLDEGALEEVEILLSVNGDCIVCCSFDQSSGVIHPWVCGALDEKQTKCLNALLHSGPASAEYLHRHFSDDESVGITAWNNRLSSLAKKGIVRFWREGKSKVYRPIFKELRYGQ